MAFIGCWYYVGRFVPSEDYPGWVVLEQPRNYGITPAVSDPLSLDDVELAAARAAFWSVGDKNFETALRNWGVHFYYPEGFVNSASPPTNANARLLPCSKSPASGCWTTSASLPLAADLW